MTDYLRGESPFEILGVPLDADDRVIRASYAKKLREARATNDPDALQRIQHAFEAIRDEEARIRLVTQRHMAEKVDPLLQQAVSAANAGDFNTANLRFRELFQAAPESELALLAFHRYQTFRGRHSQAFKAVQRLVKLAPGNLRYWRLGAETLFKVAQEDERAETAGERLQLALKHVQRAATLGDDSAAAAILESRIQWASGRRQLATKLLVDRLRTSGEMRTEELKIAIELLRLHGESGGGWAFRESLDIIATLLPESEERRRTIGLALCQLGAEFASTSVPRALACAELAEICCPQEPRVQELIEDLTSHQEELADWTEEAIQERQLVLPEPDTGSGFLQGWWCYVVLALVVKFCIFNMRSCGDDQSDSFDIWDGRGGVIEKVDMNDR